MANLTPEMAAQLSQAGILSPELANQFVPGQPPVIADTLAPEPQPIQEVVAAAMPTEQQFADNAALEQQQLSTLAAQRAIDGTTGGLAGNADTRAKQDLSDYRQLSMAEPQSLNMLEQGRLQELQARLAPQAGMPADQPVDTGETVVTPSPEQAVKSAVVQQIANDKVAEQQALKNAADSNTARQVELQNKSTAIAAQEAEKDVKQQDDAGARNLAQILNSGNAGQVFTAAIAVLMGGVAQQLGKMGANPALATLDKMVEQAAERQKLASDEKAALQKAAYDEALLRLKQEDSKTDSAYKKAQIQKIYSEIGLEREKLDAKQRGKSQIDAYFKGEPVPDSALSGLSEYQQRSLVNVKGQRYLTSSPANAEAFNKATKPISDSLAKLKQYQPIIEKGAWATLLEKGPLGGAKVGAQAQTLEAAIIGALREPITGPGAMTPVERESLQKAIGEFGFWKLPAVQAEKVKLLIKDLEAQNQRSAELYGIRAPVNDRVYIPVQDGRMIEIDDYVSNLRKQPKYQNVDPEQLKSLILQQRNSKGQ